jgi:hypothetical protein
MTFSYSMVNPSALDKLRLFIGDTNASTFVFEDEELQILLDGVAGDVQSARAGAIEILAIDAARRAIWYRINGFEMDRRSTVNQLLELSKRVLAQATTVPFEFTSMLDHHITPAGIDRSNYDDTPA